MGGYGPELVVTLTPLAMAHTRQAVVGEPSNALVLASHLLQLPVVIRPVGGKGICSSAGCDSDLRSNCSSELALESDGRIIACRSAFIVFNADEYCCRGAWAYSAPMACLSTNYSRTFKTSCPAAYSLAHDDATTIMTCSSADDVVKICSSRNQTVSRGQAFM